MGWDYSDAERDMWQLAERGGEQGDYRAGIKKKIDNVIACLKAEPLSKRATITFPFTGIEAGGTGGSETNDWTYQGQNKCCRELHLYLEDGKLKCTAIVRMQNANIFVKNIHFFATPSNMARELDVPLGEYTHWYVSHGGWGLPRAHAVRCHSFAFRLITLRNPLPRSRSRPDAVTRVPVDHTGSQTCATTAEATCC